MKKALGQTVRDFKRGVNKKVLKVPSAEQKILDATSNEPWGPHGSILAEIAQASRNYHEYQMIMAVIWKRINDTGKNWRHVFKGLTVLEYLVAHGSERVIDEIREHAHQISALASFQYIDSSGRDQGSNIRRKSQNLVLLVNDKERVEEVRRKAAYNRDKYQYQNTSTGGYGERYDDDRYEGRYGNRDEGHNGYGKEREWGYRDDDRYGKYGDSNSRDGDRYGRESEEQYGRDSYKDDSSQGRSPSVDNYNYRDGDGSNGDDGHYSSGNGVKADDLSHDGSVAGRPLDQKYSEPNIAPPSYADVVGEARSPTHSERDGETSVASASKLSSPPLDTAFSSNPAPAHALAPAPAPAPETKEFDGLDEFDPRGSFSAAPVFTNGAEMDFLGSLSDSFSSNSQAVVSTTTATATIETNPFTDSSFANGFSSESAIPDQPFEDPFGDGPFRASSFTDGFPTHPASVNSMSSFHSNTDNSEQAHPNTQTMETFNNFGFGDADILADILPPSASQTVSETHTGQPSAHSDFQSQINHSGSIHPGFQGQPDQSSSQTMQLVSQTMQPASQMGFATETAQSKLNTDFQGQGDYSGSVPDFQGQQDHSSSRTTEPHSQTMQPDSNTGFATQNGRPSLHTDFQGQINHPGYIPGFQGQPNQSSSQTMQPASQTMRPDATQTGFPTQTGHTSIHRDFQGQINHPGYIPGFQGQPNQSFSQTTQPVSHTVRPDPQSGFTTQTGNTSLHRDFQGQSNHPGYIPGFQGQPNQSSSQTTQPVSQTMRPDSQTGFATQTGHTSLHRDFQGQINYPGSVTGLQGQPDQSSSQLSFQVNQSSSTPGFPAQMANAQHLGFTATGQPIQPGANFYVSYNEQSRSTAPAVQPTGQPAHYNATNFIQPPGKVAPEMQQAGYSIAMTSKSAPPASTNALAMAPQPVKDKFETKSTIWADTLNRGLVDLNISGSKTNPLDDIGVDFDAINRKEKRMEKPSQTPVVSTITMGKAMGSGSGIGRAGAGALRGAPNPMMGSGIHMSMGGVPGAGMGMIGAGMNTSIGGPGSGIGMGGPPGGGMGMAGARVSGMGMGAGYGMNQSMGGMSMGMGAGMNMGVGAGMNMGMGPGMQMQQPTGFPPGSTMPGGYNPMMGTGQFNQQPYNGSYR